MKTIEGPLEAKSRTVKLVSPSHFPTTPCNFPPFHIAVGVVFVIGQSGRRGCLEKYVKFMYL